jgi:phosphate starvation-inducible PhoH-like protein
VLGQVEAECPGVVVVARGNSITVSGAEAEVDKAHALITDVVALARAGVDLGAADVTRASRIKAQTGKGAASFLSEPILSSKGKTIRPKTLGQKNYVEAIDSHTIVFGIGPAGTGKTYLAMAKAVQALERKEVDRIILTRPAVEAGERLGFLPGTLTDKIDPYLRPLFDALHEMMDPELVPKLLASGTVEVAPLAYMRGRTLNSSFIILDEAQNTSPEQMKMFLTRLGFGSTMVITGDVTQVDLPGGASGLKLVGGILEDIEDIHFHYLSAEDVVRHSLVSEIVDAYARFDAKGVKKGGR